MGDLNDHHQEWLGSTTTNRLGVASFDFATVHCWDQLLVVGPTRARDRTLDLLMIDVPDVARVTVVAPIGSSDHSLLSTVISMVAIGPINTKLIGIHYVVQYRICLGEIFVLLTILLRFRSCMLYIPTKVIHMHDKDKPWQDDQ